MSNEFEIFKALEKRAKEENIGKAKRINFAKILNAHFKKNGYGKRMFESVTESNNSEKEKNGKSE